MSVGAVEFPTPESSPVLILDDDPELLRPLEAFIAGLGYPVRAVTDGEEAHDALLDFQPVVLIVDLDLGGESGFDFITAALELREDLAVIAMSGVGNEQAAARCFRLGASDYLTKPFDLFVIGQAVHRALIRRASDLHRHEHEKELRQRAEESELRRRKTALEVLRDVAFAAELKHPFLKGHSRRVGALCGRIGRYLELPPGVTAGLEWAGLIHDVGMVGAPDASIGSNAELTAEERAQVRSHATLGGKLVRAQGLSDIAAWVESHHERLDGSGYPGGLTGRKIPREGLIVGVAEAYAALTESRPYREACPPSEAIAILRGAEGVWFPSRLIDAIESSVDESGGAASAELSA